MLCDFAEHGEPVGQASRHLCAEESVWAVGDGV